MPKVLVLKAQGRSSDVMIFGRLGGKSWPGKITSCDGCFLLNLGCQTPQFQMARKGVGGQRGLLSPVCSAVPLISEGGRTLGVSFGEVCPCLLRIPPPTLCEEL